MSVLGPSRIILIKAGKFDYAEVELHGALHLVGANNVGKTSLVAALQFLYVDDQRALAFSRSPQETKRYYFPDHYSHVLFECLTPTGFRVVGVHGLGPLRQYDFERYTYQGEFDVADFIDETRKPREPEAVKLRLADRGYTQLEPHHLRAALTGAGDSRSVLLGIIPLRQKNQYEHFRRVFQNLLRLSHLKQEELKALLVEAHQSEFHRIELDLSTDYKTQYRRVTEERDDIARMRHAEPTIRRVLGTATMRDDLRRKLPILWRRIKRGHTMAKARFLQNRSDDALARESFENEQNEIKIETAHLRDLRDEQRRLVDTANNAIMRLDRQTNDFKWYEPSADKAEKTRLRNAADDLTHRIQSAVKADRAAVERDLRDLQEKQRELKDMLLRAADLVGVRLRGAMSEEELRSAFTVINPHLLSLPLTRDGDGGVAITNEQRLVERLRDVAQRSRDGRFDEMAVCIDPTRLKSPNVARYVDSGVLRTELGDLERKIVEHEGVLAAIEERKNLETQRSRIEKQIKSIDAKLEAYDAWRSEIKKLPDLQAERDRCQTRIHEIDQAVEALVERREAIVQQLSDLNRSAEEATNRERRLDERVHKLKPPPGDATGDHDTTEDAVEVLDETLADYESSRPKEVTLSENISDILTNVERETGGRYVGIDEMATLSRLEQELDGLDARTTAVENLWETLIVQLRQALKRLVQDLDTLKSRLQELNRRIGSVNVSNLDRVHLELIEVTEVVSLLRKIIQGDDMPLFTNKKDVDAALARIGDLLQSRPRLSLLDMFRVQFSIIGADQVEKRYQQLDQIESNGTTITIKVLVNLMLLKSLLSDREVRIPFYLDEVANLDAANLSAIVELARRLGFVSVLASPEARDVADNVYYLNDHKGRITLDPRRDRVRIDHDRSA